MKTPAALTSLAVTLALSIAGCAGGPRLDAAFGEHAEAWSVGAGAAGRPTWESGVSFGPWHTAPATRTAAIGWSEEVLGLGAAGPARHFRALRVEGTAGSLEAECLQQRLEAIAPFGVPLDLEELRGKPVLACAFRPQGATGWTLAWTFVLRDTGRAAPAFEGELRNARGVSFAVRSVQPPGGAPAALDRPAAYTLDRGTLAAAAVETRAPGRVIISRRESDAVVLAAASAALLLFEPPTSTAPAPGPAAAAPAAPAAPAAAGAPAPAPGIDFAALLAAPDRTDADRELDAGRHPAELLAFMRIRPGMRVAELGAADGYTTELLARAVGPGGTVYAQNSKSLLAMVGRAWPRRLSRAAMRPVVPVEREFSDPLPPEARGLDLVVIHAVYHDLVWLDVDRARMNRAVLAALAPGGAYVIVDSSAKAGAGRDAPYELHRIDEAWVRREVEAAGFKLAGEGTFLRNPGDARDWNAAPNEAGARRGTSDRFALRYVKP